MWFFVMIIKGCESVRWTFPILKEAWGVTLAKGIFFLFFFLPFLTFSRLFSFLKILWNPLLSTKCLYLPASSISHLPSLISQLYRVIENLFKRENHLLTLYSYYYRILFSIITVWWFLPTLSKCSSFVLLFLFKSKKRKIDNKGGLSFLWKWWRFLRKWLMVLSCWSFSGEALRWRFSLKVPKESRNIFGIFIK